LKYIGLKADSDSFTIIFSVAEMMDVSVSSNKNGSAYKSA